MTTTPIKVAFSDPSIYPLPASFLGLYELMQEYFSVQLCPIHEADYLFYSDFGINHINFKGVKIFITGENHPPRWIECDYAFTHEPYDSDRHIHLPYWVHNLIGLRESDENKLIQRPAIRLDELRAQKRKFANFVYRNHVCKTRNRFFKKLDKCKRVDSAGPWLNNMGDHYLLPKGWQQNQNFAAQYKFTISFENESHPGYTTEKITHPLIGRSVPIYWGDPEICRDFNPNAFINYFDFKSEEELIKHILTLDANDDLLLTYLNAPALRRPDTIDHYRQKVLEQLKRIFSSKALKRSQKELLMFEVDKRIGRNASKVFKHWKRAKFAKNSG